MKPTLDSMLTSIDLYNLTVSKIFHKHRGIDRGGHQDDSQIGEHLDHVPQYHQQEIRLKTKQNCYIH